MAHLLFGQKKKYLPVVKVEEELYPFLISGLEKLSCLQM